MTGTRMRRSHDPCGIGGRQARRLHRDSSGIAAVEFAVIAPTMILALIGACDIGFMFYRQMQVDAAAWAGATYAAKYGWDTSTQAKSQQSQTNIQTAAQDATTLGASVTATATLTTGCLDTSTGALYASGNPKCTGNVTRACKEPMHALERNI